MNSKHEPPQIRVVTDSPTFWSVRVAVITVLLLFACYLLVGFYWLMG